MDNEYILRGDAIDSLCEDGFPNFETACDVIDKVSAADVMPRTAGAAAEFLVLTGWLHEHDKLVIKAALDPDGFWDSVPDDTGILKPIKPKNILSIETIRNIRAQLKTGYADFGANDEAEIEIILLAIDKLEEDILLQMTHDFETKNGGCHGKL